MTLLLVMKKSASFTQCIFKLGFTGMKCYIGLDLNNFKRAENKILEDRDDWLT